VQFVLETHLHNDYVSGGVEAARRTGAELVMPAAAAPAYDSRPAFHMEDIQGEGFTIRPLHTPGHTPEHTSYVVLLDGEPVAVFSGGSLLVASAGRPDLLGMARARTLGKLQHISINRIAQLPDHVELLPTHGEGSFCTASGAGTFTSTVGQEKATNPLLKLATPDEMADALLAAPMPVPAFYKYMGPANTLGVPDMRSTDVPEMTVAALETLPDDTRVVDIRPRAEQADGILAGSLAIELSDDFGSWAAWLTDHYAPIVLVAGVGPEADEAVQAAVTQLAQVGVDDVRGVIRDLTGAQLNRFALQDLETFKAGLGPEAQVLDVRMPNEQADTPLPGAVRALRGRPGDRRAARRHRRRPPRPRGLRLGPPCRHRRIRADRHGCAPGRAGSGRRRRAPAGRCRRLTTSGARVLDRAPNPPHPHAPPSNQ
jgi:hydroxyacylglutathione hydrolase